MKLEYDGISPITNNKCVLEEANTQDNSVSYLCMESGFTSHENLTEGSEFQQKYEERMTDLMQSCKVLDENNKAWYPTFMQLPGGMLYAQGKTAKDYFNYASSIADSPSKKDTKSKDPIIGILNKAKITKKKKLLGTER